MIFRYFMPKDVLCLNYYNSTSKLSPIHQSRNVSCFVSASYNIPMKMIKWCHITSTFDSTVHRFKWRMAKVDLEMWDKINHRWLIYNNSSEEPILWDNLLFPLNNLIPLYYKYNIKISCRTMAGKTLEYEGSIFFSIIFMHK